MSYKMPVQGVASECFGLCARSNEKGRSLNGKLRSAKPGRVPDIPAEGEKDIGELDAELPNSQTAVASCATILFDAAIQSMRDCTHEDV